MGEKPDAALDESQKDKVEREAEALQRKEKIQSAGGQLLGAAFSFIGEIFTGKEETEEAAQMTESFKNRLSECLDRGPDGSLRMTITLPDETVLDNFARSLAKMASFQDR